MVEAGNKTYGPVLAVQFLIIFLDVGINTAAPLLYERNTVQLVLYMLQDISTVMAIIIMFLSFSATYVFQAGLISTLLGKFQATVWFWALYLGFSILYHIWSLSLRWGKEYEYVWNAGLTVCYVLQRTLAMPYYYFYKRTALMLGDPRFHQDSSWLREKIDQR